MSLKKVVSFIKRNKNFLITSHTSLEGDALGSELAFYRLLKKIDKFAIIINQDNLPFGYDFLSDSNYVKKFNKKLKNIKFDCLVVLDSSGLDRIGRVSTINKEHKPILNIDHHISNERFGNVNWIEPTAASCTQMIYKLYKKMHIPLDRQIATCLYVGILTDTGSFHYSNTTGLTHKIVAELLKYNLDITKIYKNIFENIPFSDMKLLIKILPALRLYSSGKLAYLQIGRNILKKQKKISFDLTENILSFARAIKNVEVAVLCKENLGLKDEVRVNLRSQGRVDVNKIANFFGGGGHKTASGCTIKGKIDRVTIKVLNKIRESLRDF